MSDDDLYLPDDLEERWPTLGLQQDAIRKHWRVNVHRMSWQQRRRIHKLLGGPITSGGSCSFEDDSEERALRVLERELKRKYGADGYKLICVTADKAAANRHFAPYINLLRWAAGVYERGDVLV